MTVIVRIVRKTDTWMLTVNSDQANTIGYEAECLTVNNANGKFRLHATGTDGTHLDVMADIIQGPIRLGDYCVAFLKEASV